MGFNRIYLFLVGILLIIVGIFTANHSSIVFSFLNLIVPSLLIINGFTQLTQKSKGKKWWYGSIIADFLLAIICIFSGLSLDTLGLFFRIYFFVENGALLIRSQNFLKKHHVSKVLLLLISLSGLVLSILLLFSLLLSKNQILFLLGMYLIVSGIHNIVLSVIYLYFVDISQKIQRKLRITLPVVMNALFPRFALKKLNKELAGNNEIKSEVNQSVCELPDLEVFIHVTEKSFGSIGHMDLCFEGEVISYGNYDSDSTRLYESAGDGVLVTKAKRNKYLSFCIEHNQKTMFCFGIRLTTEQKQAVREHISEVMKDAYAWQSHSQRDPSQQFEDYASCLTKEVGSELYKFQQGSFQRYFVLTTNCVLFADGILSSIGIDLLSVDGILAPGTYLDYLINEYKRKDSDVVTLNIYNDAKKLRKLDGEN